MELPNRKKASISRRKLTQYLLSLTHERGKSKAKFFRGIGFDETNIEVLESSLLKIAKSDDILNVDETKSDYVIKYVIDGIIDAPNGKRYKVRTVWAIKIGSETPHFITAIPGV